MFAHVGVGAGAGVGVGGWVFVLVHVGVWAQDLSRKSDAYVGKCKSNFVGTEFTLWDSGNNPKGLKDGEEVFVSLV